MLPGELSVDLIKSKQPTNAQFIYFGISGSLPLGVIYGVAYFIGWWPDYLEATQRCRAMTVDIETTQATCVDHMLKMIKLERRAAAAR